jgi:hypothetical protein
MAQKRHYSLDQSIDLRDEIIEDKMRRVQSTIDHHKYSSNSNILSSNLS